MTHDGLSAYQHWQNEKPALIILDLNLPKLNGLSLCRKIRAQDDTPIIILSVRGQEDDIVEGLNLGADDYIVKPFSPRQLVARVEAVLRRAKEIQPSPESFTIGDLTLDPARNQVSRVGATEIRLTRLESRLLEVLMRHRNQVLLTNTLIEFVWGPEGGDRLMLKQLVYRLRHKIEACPAKPVLIKTVTGLGYTFGSDCEICY